MNTENPLSNERQRMFDLFSSESDPFFSVTFRQDVTNLVNYAHSRGLSFYLSLVYLSTKAINETEPFLFDIIDGQVIRLEERSPSFTDIRSGDESFHIVTLPVFDLSMEEYTHKARKVSDEQEEFIRFDLESSSLIYFSCMPWIDITGMKHNRNFDRDDTIPRITWGKYTLENGRYTLGMTLEVNHRLVDGACIGAFARHLSENINELQP